MGISHAASHRSKKGGRGAKAVETPRVSSATVWRYVIPWLFAIAIAANLLALATLTLVPWNGTTGLTLAPSGQPFISRALTVSAPALGAGFRPGDLFDKRDQYRANGFANPVAGRSYTLIAHRGSQMIERQIIPLQVQLVWHESIRFLVILWLLLFAVLLARRAEKSKENALLLITLLLIAFESPLNFRAVWPDTRLTFFVTVLGGFGWGCALVALVVYGSQFGRPLSWLRHTLFAVALAACALDFMLYSVVMSTVIFPWADTQNGAGWWISRAFARDAFSMFLVTLSLGSAIGAARLDERRRVAWVLASFVPFFLGIAAGGIGHGSPAWSALQNVSLLFVPAGLTYAAVTRRLFDIGFIINRAAVFTVISLLVIGAFVILEWALGKWFENASHATSLALNIALALAVGLSIRFIHRYVDRTVDFVFFRKRHENEHAIRTCALEAPYVTDRSLLLGRTIDVLEKHADCVFARMLLEDADGDYGDVDENDPAVVRLRATHGALDLHSVASSIAGEMAYPMVARGKLVGVLVLGPRRTGESYAPDESVAIAHLALSVGAALDVLANKQGDGVGATLARIESSIERLGQEFREKLSQFTEDTPGKTSLPQ